MPITRRIFVSLPADKWLSKVENDLKWGIVEEIENLGYTTEIFFDPRKKKSLASGKAWNAKDADAIMRRCVGAAIIGIPRKKELPDGLVIRLPTEYNHYEGAVAYTLGLPMLVLSQEGIEPRVVFGDNYKGYVGKLPRKAGRSWLQQPDNDFQISFHNWKVELEKRKDVFLGYCGAATPTAHLIRDFLENQGVSVLDWQRDLKTTGIILDEIRQAAERCSGGVFLFTNDDMQTNSAGEDKAVPRDNVVFETGYFINAKSTTRVCIVLEKGVKIPADLGGKIYLHLENRNDIEPIKDLLIRTFDEL